MAGYPAIFSNPVPAPVPVKTVPGTGYLSRIVLGPFWQLVELSSPGANAKVSAFKLQKTSESCRPTVLHILVVDLAVSEHTKLKTNTGNNTFFIRTTKKPKYLLLCNKYPDIRFWPDSSFDIRYYPVPVGF